MVYGSQSATQMSPANDKMSIGNSGATTNSIRKSIGKKGSKGVKKIHAYTRSRSLYNSIHPIQSYPIYRGGKGKKE